MKWICPAIHCVRQISGKKELGNFLIERTCPYRKRGECPFEKRYQRRVKHDGVPVQSSAD